MSEVKKIEIQKWLSRTSKNFRETMSEIIDATNANAEAIALVYGEGVLRRVEEIEEQFENMDGLLTDFNGLAGVVSALSEDVGTIDRDLTKLTERVERLKGKLEGHLDLHDHQVYEPDTAQGAKIRPEHAHRMEQEGRWECTCKSPRPSSASVEGKRKCLWCGKEMKFIPAHIETPEPKAIYVCSKNASHKGVNTHGGGDGYWCMECTAPARFVRWEAETPEAETVHPAVNPWLGRTWAEKVLTKGETPETGELDLEAIRDWACDQELDEICDKYEAIIKGQRKELLELREEVARGAEVIDDLLGEKDKEIERLKFKAKGHYEDMQVVMNARIAKDKVIERLKRLLAQIDEDHDVSIEVRELARRR